MNKRTSNDGDRTGGDAATELPTWKWGKLFEFHPVVFSVSAAIIAALVLLCFLVPSEALSQRLTALRVGIGDQFGWLYVATMSAFVGLAVWLAVGPYHGVRLGRDDERPEFSRLSWFAMLFSAGMGIGLLFFSVAEPIGHYRTTPPGFAEGLDESRLAMAVTIFHWGIHPWALYAIVGLSLAYFSFRLRMPLSFRSVLHPLLGDRVWKRTGDAVDVLTILATLVGVSTSLGIGAQQINAGLTYLFGVESGVGVQVALIAAITAVATVSVVIGLDGGIRRLSELNIGMAALLMVLTATGGGFMAFLSSAVESFGAYLQALPFNAFRTGALNPEGRLWINGSTVFYWAWWISWSPFVGMFIARVSRGRTIREFVVGVLLVPTVVGVLWLTAFGATTLRQHAQHLESVANDAAYDPYRQLPTYKVATLDGEGSPVLLDDGRLAFEERPLTAVEYMAAPVVSESGFETIDQTPTVLFVLLEGIFDSSAVSVLAVTMATICIVLFFVTSSDSASMVIDIIASGGKPDPPVGTRLFWAINEGLVAAALLIAGGLNALQAAAIAAALPLVFILLASSVSLVTTLAREERPS